MLLNLVRGWSNVGYEKDCEKTGTTASAIERAYRVPVYDIDV
jgi:hypothetical protein